ncbi:Serologically defined colon cancer antigen 8-like [Papilio machaon]|uniref:Serologically defined colon cancer antigen 8-like n=1 Tax=Papilio machaon TaxID=76193 RepID=A0A194RIH2_PAPMA|nr:Serologically defined colon cancer antigen 8-like [Papilio machaon]
MGSTSYNSKSKGYRVKSGSSVGSDKEMNGKLKRSKIRRWPVTMSAYFSYRRPKMEYGSKRIPDYTELAYKEAVSKLRYFLSGSAPSVRSYGGSASIKNLEESDGDLDKKYSVYSGLNEYKPRPRLTAKYTTLYADSLNNYTPKVTSTPQPVPQAPPAELSGGTNPDVVNFIQKQEEYIEQLERESQYCRSRLKDNTYSSTPRPSGTALQCDRRHVALTSLMERDKDIKLLDELNNLLGKVKEVISENEHLHEAQKNKIISRMFHYDSETDELDDVGDSTGLDSDNKVATPSKSRRAKPRTTKLEGPNIVFESRIAELEAQLTQAKIDLKKVQDENNENKRKLASGLVDSTCLDGFKRQIDNLQRDKSALEGQIAKLKTSMEQKESDGEGRYKRSDVVEHQLREERNNLEAEVRRLKDDLAKERSKIRELAGEGARRAIQERNSAEQRYNAHFDELQHDLAAQYDNVAKLQLDLDRQRREESDLKRELSMKNANIEELKMELKNKTATLQADLAQAHAEKASLEEELANARLAIERQQRQAKHETNRLNSEIQSLRQRLDRADADLVHSRRENLRLSEQISTLEKELNMKSLTPISPEKNKKELSTMLESMENKHGRAQSRGRVDEPIRTQPDRSTSRETEKRRKHRSGKESDSSNNQPIIVGPLTTNQDLSSYHGEKIYNLPLMIQQPFLREKKEPIKVDISVKLIPKPRKRDRKRRESHVEVTSPSKPVKSNISMVVTNGNIQVLNETVDENVKSPKITNNLNSPKINSDKNEDGEELDLSKNDLLESKVDKTLDSKVEDLEIENTNDVC